MYKQMNEDTLISELYGIWDTALIAQNVSKGKGKWAVAPLPEWPDRPGGATWRISHSGAQGFKERRSGREVRHVDEH
ncbi:solute-binding lipoprotein [Cutibacterium acnes JCM 18909]|nr:solute-binding lipoprotein [Cutibacterium acnes JCM 18909]